MEKKKYLATWIPVFLNDELTLNQCVSINTRYSYRDALKKLTAFLTVYKKVPLHKITIQMLDIKTIRAYLDNLEVNGCRPSTRNQRLAALKSFFHYLGKECPEYQHIAGCRKEKRKVWRNRCKKIYHTKEAECIVTLYW